MQLTVGSALSHIFLYVKLVARHSLRQGPAMYERVLQQVRFAPVQLHMMQWCDWVGLLVDSCSRTLHAELLFALPGTERFPRMHQLREDWFDKRPGANFLDNAANEALLAPWRHWLLAHVDTHPATRALTLSAGGAEPHWHTPGIRQYLQRVRAFLRQLLLLMHLTAGLPLRGRALVSLRCCNTAQLRNLFLYEGSVMLLLSERGQQRMCFLPAIVGD